MDSWSIADSTAAATALVVTDTQHLDALLDGLDAQARAWCRTNRFSAANGQFITIPAPDGGIALVIAGCRADQPLQSLASLPRRLPPGRYQLDQRSVALDRDLAKLGWALGAYRFDRYSPVPPTDVTLAMDAATHARLAPLARATCQVRDLVNTPTQDMGPEELADVVAELARQHGARYRQWLGDELLVDNFPAIHAVGRASHRAPRLAMLEHGDADMPHVVLVGKGVCFDTGGLDIKSSQGMRWMKKDMGGAAHAIALAGLLLQARLPIRLTLLVPAVENAISSESFRPGEVIRTRAGVQVEVDNTDAEGRLVLCDALALAREAQPDLIIDFATLTGAARIALGPDLPALFSNDDAVADGVLAAGLRTADPLWRMPLWQPYLAMLESSIADLANSGASRHAGAITAALFLQRFVDHQTPWCHIDVYSWSDKDQPARPRGGEAQGLRAMFAWLSARYGNTA